VFQFMAAGLKTECYDGQYFFDSDHPVGGGTVSNTGGGSGTPWYLLDLNNQVRPLILQWRKKPEFVALDDPKDENVFMRKKFRYGVDDRKNVGFTFWQLAWGDKQALNAANFKAAYQAMMEFKNDEGDPLGVVPTHLVVPPSLMETAKKLINSDLVATDAGGVENNPWKDIVEVMVVPWLS